MTRQGTIHKQIAYGVRLFGFATQWWTIKYNAVRHLHFVAHARTIARARITPAFVDTPRRYVALLVRFYKIVGRPDFP